MTNVIESAAPDMLELSDEELGHVTGGFLPVLVAAALDGFSAGVWIGSTIVVGWAIYKAATMK